MKRKVHYVIGKVGNRVGQEHSHTGAYMETWRTLSVLSSLVCHYYSHIHMEALLVFILHLQRCCLKERRTRKKREEERQTETWRVRERHTCMSTNQNVLQFCGGLGSATDQ